MSRTQQDGAETRSEAIYCRYIFQKKQQIVSKHELAVFALLSHISDIHVQTQCSCRGQCDDTHTAQPVPHMPLYALA